MTRSFPGWPLWLLVPALIAAVVIAVLFGLAIAHTGR